MFDSPKPLELSLYVVSDSYVGADVEVKFKLKSSAKRIVKQKIEDEVPTIDTDEEEISDDEDDEY